MNGIFVTGCGTGIGKTVVSAIAAEALGAVYWKPIQAGNIATGDRAEVTRLLGSERRTLPERYRLSRPMSPHAAAALDGVTIDPAALMLPRSADPVVVEGAGGVMVPITKTFLMLDLIEQLALPVLLVSKNYLGSINHTLLSTEALLRRGVRVIGIVFNGERAPSSEDAILSYSGLPHLLSVSEEPKFSRDAVVRYAAQLRPALVTALGVAHAA
jgi:dethiobiotin synthetase